MSCLATFLVLLCLTAQESKPSFEVASIKPPTPLGPMGMRANHKGGPGTGDPGTYTCENCPVSWVVSEGYSLQPYEYGGPEWLQNTRFDFVAKIPPGTTKESFHLMLQNLLADRFQMVVHRQNKEVSGYKLVVAKGGPKFRESVPKEPEEDGPQGKIQRDAEGFPILRGSTSMAAVGGHARMRSMDQPLKWLADMLAGQLNCPVVDATGLTAKYDFTVSWASDEQSAVARQDAYQSALIRALETQLGLKLEKASVPVSILMIDHIEKTPSGN
jgi:uncharacterized protein (TIGR03435 family)